MPMSDRTYSEREITAILARAAEEQRRGPNREGAPGLTLSEIERAGAEAGIAPALVRQAAADLDAGFLALDPDRPNTAVVERWVDAPLCLAAWEDVVAALQVRYGSGTTGAPSAREGASLEWTHASVSGTRTTVTASPREGCTRVRVVVVDGGSADPRWQSAALSLVGGLMLGLLAGAGVAEGLGWGDPAGVATLLLTLVAATAIGTPLLVRSAERRRTRQAAEAGRLADDIAHRLANGMAAADASEQAEPLRADPQEEGPRLDLSDLDAEPPESAPPPTRRRTRS